MGFAVCRQGDVQVAVMSVAVTVQFFESHAKKCPRRAYSNAKRAN